MAFRRIPLRYDLPLEVQEGLREERKLLREQNKIRKNFVSSFSNLTPKTNFNVRRESDPESNNNVSRILQF